MEHSTMPDQDRDGDWREEVDASILELHYKAVEQGVAPGRLAEAMLEAMEGTGHLISQDLIAAAPAFAQSLTEERDRWRESIRNVWGDALDLFAAVVHGIEEWYSDYHERRCGDDDAHGDLAFWVLAGLMSRAVRTAKEVHTLLCDGFPAGAIGRARTVQETATISHVIAQHRETNVAERYIAHATVDSYKRMRLYQKHVEDLGFEPFTDEEMAAAKRDYDLALARYGRGFAGPYGWATVLFDENTNPTIADLEDLSQLDRMRLYRKWADHEIHPTSHGGTLNVLDDPAGRHRVTGPVIVGLADPAQIALISLVQVFTGAVVHGRPTVTRPTDLTVLSGVHRLLRHALERFAQIELASP